MAVSRFSQPRWRSAQLAGEVGRMAATEDSLSWVLTVGFNTVFTLNSGVVLPEGRLCAGRLYLSLSDCV